MKSIIKVNSVKKINDDVYEVKYHSGGAFHTSIISHSGITSALSQEDLKPILKSLYTEFKKMIEEKPKAKELLDDTKDN